jgi:hypothetical protein
MDLAPMLPLVILVLIELILYWLLIYFTLESTLIYGFCILDSVQ